MKITLVICATIILAVIYFAFALTTTEPANWNLVNYGDTLQSIDSKIPNEIPVIIDTGMKSDSGTYKFITYKNQPLGVFSIKFQTLDITCHKRDDENNTFVLGITKKTHYRFPFNFIFNESVESY